MKTSPFKNYKATTIEAYSTISKSYQKARTPNFWLKEFRALIKLAKSNGLAVKESAFLDLGCGPGVEAHLALNEGMSYVGVDLSKKMLKIARKVTRQGKFIRMDVTDLKFEDDKFDVVWACAVLLHLIPSDINKALKEIKRVLKPSHFAFISIEKRQKDQEKELMKKSIKGGKVVNRYRILYTQPEFRKMLKKAKFSVEKIISRIEPRDKKEWLCFFVKNKKTSSNFVHDGE